MSQVHTCSPLLVAVDGLPLERVRTKFRELEPRSLRAEGVGDDGKVDSRTRFFHLDAVLRETGEYAFDVVDFDADVGDAGRLVARRANLDEGVAADMYVALCRFAVFIIHDKRLTEAHLLGV